MRLLRLIAALLVLALPAIAQDGDAPVMLVADTIRIEGRSILIAEGNVEALQGERRLKAARVVYDRDSGQLTLDGPVTLTEGDRVIVLADSGQLDAGMQNGLLRGARMIFDRQVQLAASRIDRVGGRYTQMYQVAATSCRVCDEDSAPIWQIRARRVIHDQAEQQLYFENATLQVLNVPILWLPRLRLPDPTLTRASGFLIPELRQKSDLGLGIKVPYFLRLGDHRDLTLTPYLSSQTKTLEWRFRQAFHNGTMTLGGAISRDDLRPGDTRLWLDGAGRFDLRGGWRLDFDIEAVSDKAYVVDYDYSAKDRLDGELAVSRTARDRFSRASLTVYQTLRAGEDNSTLPTVIGEALHEQRFFPAGLGGEIRVAAMAHSHYRYSDLDVAGRDIGRTTLEAQWLRSTVIGPGMVATSDIGLALDGFAVNQDTTATTRDTAVTPHANVTLRWPFQKTTARAIHIIEPLVMLGWVGGTTASIPNEESTRVEFDEGNLLSLARFPAADRREHGSALAYGVAWTRVGTDGWRSALTMGQVMRDTGLADFTRSSGLAGTSSSVLLAGQLQHAQGFDLHMRGLIDPGDGATKAEARLAWLRPTYGLGASYVWLGQDLAEARPGEVSEWSLDGYRRLSRHWTATTNWRYDIASDQTAQAGMGLQFRNECIELNLTVARRYTASTIVAPSTDFGFTVSLGGVGVRTGDASYTRACRG